MTTLPVPRASLPSILIASTDERVRRSASVMLESTNLPIQETCDFQSIVNTLLLGGPFLAIIYDTDLCRYGSGFLIRMLSERYGHIPCMIVSGNRPMCPSTPCASRCDSCRTLSHQQSHPDGLNMPIIRKPLEPTAFFAALRGLLGPVPETLWGFGAMNLATA